MWTNTLMPLIMRLIRNPWIRGAVLAFYYLAILIILIWMYGKGDFSTPGFVYQEF